MIRHPLEFNVFLKQEEVKQGVLALPDDILEKRKHQQTLGVVAHLGRRAGEAIWDDDAPQIGDRVLFVQHAGTFVKDDDGTEYRVVKDKDIVAVLA
jgi:co-chaperonin GroES (HSP10)